MATNTIQIDTPPDAVWEVLADPRLYGNWVVGASTTRDVEGDWPQPGAVLHHTQMMLIRDTTSVLESEPQRRLVLDVRARPAVRAKVDIRLEPQDGGTHVTFIEEPYAGVVGLLPKFARDAMIGVRNVETVKRLKSLAELGRRLGRA